MDHALRRARLAERLRALELEGVLVTRLPNVRYLTGFSGSNGQAVVAADGSAVFLTDGRYGEQSSHEVADLELTVYREDHPRPLIEACRGLGIGKVGFERRGLTFGEWEQLSELANGIQLVPTEPEVERLRRVKDPDELALIERSQACADAAFRRVMLDGGLRPGRTERQLARDLEDAMLEAGADDRAFDTIVAFGEHGAEPHHAPTHRALNEGDAVTIDFGALTDGYHSDMTRTLAFGAPDARVLAIREAVAAAQAAGIAAVAPGVSSLEVDAAARAEIEAAGYGEAFPHGLGHGVGLEIHEAPFLSWRANEAEALAEGMVVTIEPGVYVPGLGGVRIEDVVEVTADGGRTIPASTRELVVP